MANGMLSQKLSNLFVEKDIDELVGKYNNQEEARLKVEKM